MLRSVCQRPRMVCSFEYRAAWSKADAVDITALAPSLALRYVCQRTVQVLTKEEAAQDRRLD